MTKRLHDFVNSIDSVDELRELSELSEERYRDKCSLITANFFSLGRDVVLGHIFQRICREVKFSKLLVLREVSHTWSDIVRQSEYAMMHKLPWYFYRKILDNIFTRVLHIDTTSYALDNDPITTFSQMKTLSIHEDEDRCRVIWNVKLDTWTSLESLVIDLDFVCHITGIEQLTSLTSLQCSALCLPNQEIVTSLLNLTVLKIADFSTKLIISLPKLTHLESDFPGHFTKFTGTGKLDTKEFNIYNYPGPEKKFIQSTFDRYFHDSCELKMEGAWLDGVFSGRALITLMDGFEDLYSFTDGVATLIEDECLMNAK